MADVISEIDAPFESGTRRASGQSVMQKRWVEEGLDRAPWKGGEVAGQRRDHQELWLQLRRCGAWSNSITCPKGASVAPLAA